MRSDENLGSSGSATDKNVLSFKKLTRFRGTYEAGTSSIPGILAWDNKRIFGSDPEDPRMLEMRVQR